MLLRRVSTLQCTQVVQVTTSAPRVAVIAPMISGGGGVATVAHFLYLTLATSGRYAPDLISVAMSATDETSTRLLSPKTWRNGPCITEGIWEGIPFRHAGAVAAEVEWQRYRPRRVLDKLLEDYDLIQIVAGTPTWALVAGACRQPVGLQVATLTASERGSALSQHTGWRRWWGRIMTAGDTVLERRAVRRADVIFVENDWMQRWASKQVGPQRVQLALPGVDTGRFYPSADRSGAYILSVSRFGDPRKNTALLLRAYRCLRQMVSDVPKLLLAGRSAPVDNLQQQVADLGLSGHVEIRQDVKPEDLADLYRGACLFVLSSDEEGLGLVVLEAMASGLPVVSTRCGGPEMVVVDGETGLLTPVGDAAALTSAMKRLLDAPDLRQHMGQRARRVAEDRFSYAAAGRIYLERYDLLLSRNGT